MACSSCGKKRGGTKKPSTQIVKIKMKPSGNIRRGK